MYLAVNVSDIVTILFLIFLEGMLSLDNALALAIIVKHLPKEQQRKALTVGIWSAFAFRILALLAIRSILGANWVRLVGGIYLLYLALKYFLFAATEEDLKKASVLSFWSTVVAVEMIDIAFSLDSILASVAISTKLYVVALGGMLGIVMMRIASSLFVGLIRRFPRLERVAYWIIMFLGGKLVVEWMRAA